ncbi:hypothetical protein J6590_047265 [Homalodisca vitripennis]|nr:hypothetical protein J6590_047265 [Homalodisca vitripennis]
MSAIWSSTTTLTYIAQRNVTMSLVRGQLIVTMSAIWSSTTTLTYIAQRNVTISLVRGQLIVTMSAIWSSTTTLTYIAQRNVTMSLVRGQLIVTMSAIWSSTPPSRTLPSGTYNVACPRSAHCHHVCNLVQNTTLTYIAQRNVEMSLVQGQLIVTMSVIWSRTPPSLTLPSGMLQCRLPEVSSLAQTRETKTRKCRIFPEKSEIELVF